MITKINMATTKSCSGYVFILQGILVIVNCAFTNGLTLDMGLTRLEITASLGQPANLGCYANVTNTTSLTYSWAKNNLTVTQSSTTRLYENVLVVTPKKASDFGMYECHVTDGVTITKCNITLLPGCNNTAHEETPQGKVGCANISVLMPVLAIVVVSLLLNIHFFVRWKRRDRLMLSEEEIMQLQEAQESVAFEERTEEPVEVKKKKPLLGRLRKRRRENDHNIDENEKTHQEIVCDSDTHGRHKEESIEMDEIPDIPSVADIKAAEKNDVIVHAPSDEDRRPVVSEPPRIVDFFQTTDDENEEIAPAPSNAAQGPPEEDTLRIADFFKATDDVKDDSASESSGTPRRPAVAEPPRIADFFTTTDEEIDDTTHALPDTPRSSTVTEPPRIAEFFVPDDETDGEGSGRESMDSELPLVSHYMERMDFEGKDDSDDEPVLK